MGSAAVHPDTEGCMQEDTMNNESSDGQGTACGQEDTMDLESMEAPSGDEIVTGYGFLTVCADAGEEAFERAKEAHEKAGEEPLWQSGQSG